MGTWRSGDRAPKYGSERTVPVDDGLLGVLAEHVRVDCPGDDPGRWLFPNESGEAPISLSMVDVAWRVVRDEVGIPHRLHDLRHFYASGLIMALAAMW